jgi:predicted nucleic acid-binding protein
MSYLVDTNILLRLAEPAHRFHQITLDALAPLRLRAEPVHVVPQNLYEFWAVATKTVAGNGLGRSVAEAASEMTRIKRLFILLAEPLTLVDAWEQLVLQCSVTGTKTHDARLAAAMRLYNISSILTFNMSDFQRYPGIAAHSPQDILAQATP